MSKVSRRNQTAKSAFAGQADGQEIEQLADKMSATLMHPLFRGFIILATLGGFGTLFWQLAVAAKW